MMAWSLTVSAVGNCRMACAPRSTSLPLTPKVSARWSRNRVREEGSKACTQISALPLPPAVLVCSPLERISNPASSQYQSARDSGVNCLR